MRKTKILNPIDKTCEICGKEYITATPKSRYCSPECAYVNTRKKVIESGYNDPLSESAYRNYKNRSETRGFDFELTLDQYRTIKQQPCVYCGSFFNSFNGIDRVENHIGYTVKNSVPCCGTCNLMKHTMRVKDFLAQCRRIVKFRKTGQLSFNPFPKIGERLF